MQSLEDNIFCLLDYQYLLTFLLSLSSRIQWTNLEVGQGYNIQLIEAESWT